LLDWITLAIIAGYRISCVEIPMIHSFAAAKACAAGTNLIEEIMVVIRLARGGSKKRPFYSLVAADSRNRRDGSPTAHREAETAKAHRG